MDKYKEALERAREIYNAPVATIVTRTFLEQIFPELKESEDERIRRELLEYAKDEIRSYNNMVSGDYDSRDKEDKMMHEWWKKVVVYLEKQKEQNVVPSREIILGIWELGNLWEENPEERNGLTQLQYIQKYWFEKCDYLKWQQPAEWSDSTTKEMFIKALERAVEQTKKGYELTDCDKHSWWEDFKAYSEIKPTEWSEEDEKMRKEIINTLKGFFGRYETLKIRMQRAWLESLRPQPHWKPSEEQIKQ